MAIATSRLVLGSEVAWIAIDLARVVAANLHHNTRVDRPRDFIVQSDGLTAHAADVEGESIAVGVVLDNDIQSKIGLADFVEVSTLRAELGHAPKRATVSK